MNSIISLPRVLFNFVLIFALCLNNFNVCFAQNSEELLPGYWKGAFIKGNGAQLMEVIFSNGQEGIKALQTVEEWHPFYGEFEVDVKIDSVGKINFSTGYGEAKMVLDTNNLELHGAIEGGNPTMYLHLKKTSPNPKLDRKIEEVNFQSGDIKLNGFLHQPQFRESKTAIVLVDGRGCYENNKKYNLYGKILTQYGITVLAYNKRGSGKSEGDCATATIDDLSGDVVAAYEFLKNHPANFEKIGVIGGSAGGWTMAKAEETVDFDFMIGVVGPSTSVYDQQIQSLIAGAKLFELEPSAIDHAIAYTKLLFAEKPTKKTHQQMKDLLSIAGEEGWYDLLDDTDVAETYQDIPSLWVRRHNYDPAEVWKNYDRPVLAIYGSKDWIVPQEENIAAFKKYFEGREDLLKTVVAHDADHGMAVGTEWEDLADGHSYRRFYRISPHLQIEIVRFLTDLNLIE